MQIKTIAITPEQKRIIDDYIESVREAFNNTSDDDKKQRLEIMHINRKNCEKVLNWQEIWLLHDLAHHSTYYGLSSEEIYSTFTNLTKIKIEEVLS